MFPNPLNLPCLVGAYPPAKFAGDSLLRVLTEQHQANVSTMQLPC